MGYEKGGYAPSTEPRTWDDPTEDELAKAKRDLATLRAQRDEARALVRALCNSLDQCIEASAEADEYFARWDEEEKKR